MKDKIALFLVIASSASAITGCTSPEGIISGKMFP
jgi:hypothetical protein